MSQLDAMAASATPTVLGGSGQHLALTGTHAKTMAEKIIANMPRDNVSSKALVTGGTQTTSSILLPEIIATGRPLCLYWVFCRRELCRRSIHFCAKNSRSLAAAPTPAGSAKPVSDVGVVGIQSPLRVVATVSSAIDHYLLSDNANLMAFVTDQLVYAIRVALESQVLTGDGSGENFRGV